MRYVTLTLMAFALAACQPEIPGGEPEAAPSAEPAPAPVLGGVDLTQPLNLIGTEPFWGIKIAGGDIVYSSPEEPGKPFGAAPFSVDGDKARLNSDGLSIVLTAVKCSDGMSDREYPLTAEVTLDGKPLKGCAISTAELDATRP